MHACQFCLLLGVSVPSAKPPGTHSFKFHLMWRNSRFFRCRMVNPVRKRFPGRPPDCGPNGVSVGSSRLVTSTKHQRLFQNPDRFTRRGVPKKNGLWSSKLRHTITRWQEKSDCGTGPCETRRLVLRRCCRELDSVLRARDTRLNLEFTLL